MDHDSRIERPRLRLRLPVTPRIAAAHTSGAPARTGCDPSAITRPNHRARHYRTAAHPRAPRQTAITSLRGHLENRARPRPPFRPRSVQPSFCVGYAPQKLLFRSLALASLNHACRDLVPTFPQRSPPSLLTTAACGGLRSAPDCRTQRTFLHLSYSYAAPCGPALLVTQGPKPKCRNVHV